MSDRALRRLLAFSTLVIGLSFVFGVIAAYLARATDHGSSFGSSGFGVNLLFFTGLLGFPAVGALILRRDPRNRMGWLLMAIGAAWGVDNFLTGFASWAWQLHHRFIALSHVFVALDQGIWVPAIGLIGTFLLLLFPDGELPSPRWRPVAWISAVGLVLAWIGTTFVPGDVVGSGFPKFRNPLGISPLGGVLSRAVPIIAIIPLWILLSAASLVIRFRRSSGVGRLQLKWLAAAAAFVAVAAAAAMVATLPTSLANRPEPLWGELLQDTALFSLVLIPIAVGIAVLRYRLYDVDVIINKTLVYGVLTGLLAMVYAGLVLGLGGLVRALGGSAESPLVVAASTLAAAGLFRPVRQRVQAFIDRRFYRGRYDAQRTLAAFTATLRDEVDLDALGASLLSTVGDAVQPSRASLWLRGGS